MRSSWIIQVGPKSSDKCPYKRHTEDREMAGSVTMVVEIGLTWPPVKECLDPPEAGREKEQRVPQNLRRELVLSDTLILDFWP